MPDKPTFLQRTFEMLESKDDDACRWQPDGLSFVVEDVARLERESLPKYFRHGNFLSFVRQLHFYGFSKQTISEGRALLSHTNFQRDRPDLLDRIVRRSSDKVSNQRSVIARMKAQVETLQQRNAELSAECDNLRGMIREFHVRDVAPSRRSSIVSLSTSPPRPMQEYRCDGASIGAVKASSSGGPANNPNKALLRPMPTLPGPFLKRRRVDLHEGTDDDEFSSMGTSSVRITPSETTAFLPVGSRLV